MNKYCLYGKVIRSYSPLIHNYVFKKNGIDAYYEIYCGKDVISDLRNNIIQGINVTVPYKISIIKYLDELDDNAKRIGAVNTVINRDGKLIGYNTDYDGFYDTMKYYNVEAKKAHILGCGGAAKAVKAVLDDMDIENCFIHRCSINGNIDLLVNATSVLNPVDEKDFLRAKTVIDLHYENCTRKINGLYMLVSQALAADKIWFGIEENADEVYQYIKETIL